METCGDSIWAAGNDIPPSPVPTLIGTNAVPSPTEENQIRSTLLEFNSSLSQLDGETDRLCAVLNDHEYSCQHIPRLSLIRHFPPEILSEIFLYSIFDDKGFTLNWEAKSRECGRAVRQLTSICSRWRNVALSTSRLWSSPSFFLYTKTTEAEAEFMRSWLRRSGRQPLSIELHGDWDWDPKWEELLSPKVTTTMHNIIAMLAEHAERWRCVNFEIPYNLWLGLRGVQNRLTCLRSLTIGIRDNYRRFFPSIGIFVVAPLMTSLTMSCTSGLDFTFPWAQLTSFSNCSDFTGLEFNIDHCYDLFYGAPNLVKCQLFLSYREDVDYCHRSVVIQHLHLQTLTFVAKKDPGCLFDLIKLPALLVFRCNSMDGTSSWLRPDFLSQSQCTLKEFFLCLGDTALGGGCLMEFLRLVPTLVHLQTDRAASSCMNTQTFAQLKIPHSGPADYLAPKTEVLRFFVRSTIIGTPTEVFENMFKSQPLSHANMSILDITRDDHPIGSSLSQTSRLKDCVNEGLDIQIISYDEKGSEISTPLGRTVNGLD